LLDTTIEAQLSEITQFFLGQPLRTRPYYESDLVAVRSGLMRWGGAMETMLIIDRERPLKFSLGLRSRAESGQSQCVFKDVVFTKITVDTFRARSGMTHINSTTPDNIIVFVTPGSINEDYFQAPARYDATRAFEPFLIPGSGGCAPLLDGEII
jgi:hypothetical protein